MSIRNPSRNALEDLQDDQFSGLHKGVLGDLAEMSAPEPLSAPPSGAATFRQTNGFMWTFMDADLALLDSEERSRIVLTVERAVLSVPDFLGLLGEAALVPDSKALLYAVRSTPSELRVTFRKLMVFQATRPSGASIWRVLSCDGHEWPAALARRLEIAKKTVDRSVIERVGKARREVRMRFGLAGPDEGIPDPTPEQIEWYLNGQGARHGIAPETTEADADRGALPVCPAPDGPPEEL